MLIALLLVTCFAYVISAAVVLRELARQIPSNRRPLVSLVPWLALIGHGAIMWVQLQRDNFDHLNMAASLSAVALILALLSTLRGYRPGSLLLRPVIFLFAAVSALLVVIAPVDWGASITSQLGLVLHIILSLLAYGVLLLATLYALQLLYVTSVLKQRKSNALSKNLPPLLSIEHYFFRLLSSGTALLVVALLSGFIFMDNMFAQGQAHKTILSLVAMAIYAGVVLAHHFKGLRNRTLVISSMVACVILTLAYFGSRFVKDVLLTI